MSEYSSVVVPAYNEEVTLVRVIHKLLVVPHLLEIVIVNDCSNNSTGDIAEELARRRITTKRRGPPHPCGQHRNSAAHTPKKCPGSGAPANDSSTDW